MENLLQALVQEGSRDSWNSVGYLIILMSHHLSRLA